jgi:hypothetical protein
MIRLASTQTTARVNARIGELVRNGQTIFYAWLADDLYVENADRSEVAFYVQAEEVNAPPHTCATRAQFHSSL